MWAAEQMPFQRAPHLPQPRPITTSAPGTCPLVPQLHMTLLPPALWLCGVSSPALIAVTSGPHPWAPPQGHTSACWKCLYPCLRPTHRTHLSSSKYSGTGFWLSGRLSRELMERVPLGGPRPISKRQIAQLADLWGCLLITLALKSAFQTRIPYP